MSFTIKLKFLAHFFKSAKASRKADEALYTLGHFYFSFVHRSHNFLSLIRQYPSSNLQKAEIASLSLSKMR